MQSNRYLHSIQLNQMKTLSLSIAVLGVTVVIFAADPAFAGSKKKKEVPEPHITTISGVTADSVTIAEEKGSRTLAITPFTEIIVNGQKGRITDLQPGMTVTWALGTDPSKAARITASGAAVAVPEATPKPRKPKSSKKKTAKTEDE